MDAPNLETPAVILLAVLLFSSFVMWSLLALQGGGNSAVTTPRTARCQRFVPSESVWTAP